MEWLDLLERIGELPAEVWLIPPVVILALMAIIGWIRRALLLRDYRAIAVRTGLDVAPKLLNPSEIRGTFRGRELVMHIVSRQRPTLRKRWTRVIVTMKNPEMIGLRMWPQDALDRLVIAAGATEVVVGDEEFDRRFVIQSRDEKAVAKMFARNRDLREGLLRARIDSVHVLGTTLHVHYARSERDPSHAELLFTATTTLAEAIDALAPDYTPEIIRTR
jgi:hypothetical protein